MNPFVLKNYLGPEYFCDREKETEKIVNSIENQQDITLYAHRRLGKTALIYHVFHYLQKKNICVYADLWGTNSLPDFINEITNAIIKSNLFNNQSFAKKVISFVQSIGASISFATDGSPSVSFSYSNSKEVFKSLEEVFFFLNNQKKSVVLAIDEFQEITKYGKDVRIEEKLRKIAQASNNINFIFSGSEYHIINEIFNNPERPFYMSSRLYTLGKIEKEAYKKFIIKHFKKAKKEIDGEVVDHLYQTLFGHTFYIQSVCNYLFSLKNTPESFSEFDKIYKDYLEEKHVYYSEIPDRLTRQQFTCLQAVAKSDFVEAPTSGDFLSFSGIKNASSMQRIMKSLLDKRYLIKTEEGFRLYDVFLSNYLKYFS
jgi:uncharacterized protein YozE (UPF0346 family)